MRNTVNILGVNIDNLTMSEAVNKVHIMINENDANHTNAVYTPNAEIIMEAYRNKDLMEILNSGEIVTADGAGVILASKILGKKIKQKVSGIDLIKNCLVGPAASFYLLGGKPGVAQLACENIKKGYPNAIISGYMHGYFSPQDEEKIIEDINSSGAQILLVGFGAPKQENWIHKNRDRLNVKVCMGIGGSIDILAGTAKLAPECMRRNGFEWLYRLCKEPRRAVRMIRLPVFVLSVIKSKLFS